MSTATSFRVDYTMSGDVLAFLDAPLSGAAHLRSMLMAEGGGRGGADISHMFAVCSHVLTAMTGVLAIVSLKELGPTGVLRHSKLPLQVARLAKLAVAVACTAEQALRRALAELRSEKNADLSPSDAGGIDEILSMGDTYIALLEKVVAEIREASTLQDLGVVGQVGGMVSLYGQELQTLKVADSIRWLAEQIMELDACIEMLGRR